MRAGATDQELPTSSALASELYRWKNTFRVLSGTLKGGKSPADERVERSLFERATGYELDEVDIRGVGGEIIQTTVRKFYPLRHHRSHLLVEEPQAGGVAGQDRGGRHRQRAPIEHTHSVSDATGRLLEELSGIGADRSLRHLCRTDLYFLLRHGLRRADAEHQWIFDGAGRFRPARWIPGPVEPRALQVRDHHLRQDHSGHPGESR
jgi:hypothetical protein